MSPAACVGPAGLWSRSGKVEAGLVCLGGEPEASECILLHSGVIHLLLEIPVQQDTGQSEQAPVVNIIICILVLALLMLWSLFTKW